MGDRAGPLYYIIDILTKVVLYLMLAKNMQKLKRAYMLKAFGHAVTLEDREKCCDICSSTLRSLPEVLIQEEEHEPINIIVRQALDDAQEEDLTQQLNRLNGDRTGMYLVPKLMYPQLVKKIIKHHQNISGVQEIGRASCRERV